MKRVLDVVFLRRFLVQVLLLHPLRAALNKSLYTGLFRVSGASLILTATSAF